MLLEEKIAIKINNRVNRRIKARELRVISDSGEQLGILSTDEAIAIAEQRGLDLVEISDKSNPPVAKIIDFGKFKYEKEKAYKENKKKQKVIVVKEIKIKPQIDMHDLEIKKKRINEFLSEDKKVKVILVLRGRQRLHADRGKLLLEEVAKEFEESATIERNYSAGFSLLLSAKKA